MLLVGWGWVQSEVEEAFRLVMLGGDGPLEGGEDDVGHSPGIRDPVVGPDRDFEGVDVEEASASEEISEGETAGSGDQ
jgi:hypothetical protein